MTNRRLALRAWLHAMSVLEVRLRADQGRARNAMIRKAATEYTRQGHPPAHVFVAHRTRVKGVIEDHYRRTIPVFSGMALNQIKSRRIERKATQTLNEWLIARWIERESLRKATMIADTDRDDVIAAIQKGIDEGLGTDQIARNIRKVSQLTAYRAATVARTETHAAATYGSIESVREAERTLEIKMMKEWLPTGDNRTRPEHEAMATYGAIPLDEKFVVGGEAMDRPGDTGAEPHNTVNCLHPDSVIQSGNVKAMTRHWYEGTLLTIKTHSGNELTVTPNHPVLTRGGWVSASALHEGDSVISGTFADGVSLGTFDVNHVEATVEQIFDALSIPQVVVRVGRADVNFHGKRPDCDVDIVHAASKLRNPFVAALSKPLEHFRLASTDFAQGRLLANGLLYGNGMMVFSRLATDGFMGLLGQTGTFLWRSLGHTLEHAFATVAWGYAVVGKAGSDVIPISAIRQRELLDRLASKKTVGDLGGVDGSLSPLGGGGRICDFPHSHPGTVQTGIDRGDRNAVLLGKLRYAKTSKVIVDQVTSVSHKHYSGFVYNFETHNGYYICNGIVQHNCRCAIIYEEAE